MTNEIKVGLEVHQQLDTGSKLFCRCNPIESENICEISRKMRTGKSEIGITDETANFVAKGQTSIIYNTSGKICMVELDEAPPYSVDPAAWKTVLTVAHSLNSKIIEEVYVMRKTVVDGSNTTGFQRTMLVSIGGSFKVGTRNIGIQSICLEEDSAKMLNSKDGLKRYDLGRLGIPLIEIATEPFNPELIDVKSVALELGKILRSTRMTKRGIGSIRQDVNVSINGKNVVEIKGVQQLDLLGTVVELEVARQLGMASILQKMVNWEHNPKYVVDVTNLFINTKSSRLRHAIESKQSIHAVLFKDLKGIFKHTPPKGIRLGKDIAEIAQALGLGGILHSDELPNSHITDIDMENLKNKIGATDNDGFFIVAGSKDHLNQFVKFVIKRMESIKTEVIPKDTRIATSDGSTRFLRPKPAVTRMYPETDIPPIPVRSGDLEDMAEKPLKSWDEQFSYIQKKYGLNRQLTEQLLDSKYVELFDNIAGKDPTFVASVLCSTITNLTRAGGNPKLLTDGLITETFEMFFKNQIVKESIEIIFSEIMNNRANSIDKAIRISSINSMNTKELEKILQKLVLDNKVLIKKHGTRASKPLMGKAMNILRGKASGNTISRMLVIEIEKSLSDRNTQDLHQSNNKIYIKGGTINRRVKRISPTRNRSFDEP
ncbi:MAG: Glu-tRNA(Gln) amidotransferase subunit GatE [Nitrosopumilus sp.]|nr:Glu-tRNA(Gln) amidotransferase subunit GatE [Nitrosopumilus sp.]